MHPLVLIDILPEVVAVGELGGIAEILPVILLAIDIEDAQERFEEITLATEEGRVALGIHEAPAELALLLGGEHPEALRIGMNTRLADHIRQGLAPDRRDRGRGFLVPIDLPEHIMGVNLVRNRSVYGGVAEVAAASEEFLFERSSASIPHADALRGVGFLGHPEAALRIDGNAVRLEHALGIVAPLGGTTARFANAPEELA